MATQLNYKWLKSPKKEQKWIDQKTVYLCAIKEGVDGYDWRPKISNWFNEIDLVYVSWDVHYGLISISSINLTF